MTTASLFILVATNDKADQTDVTEPHLHWISCTHDRIEIHAQSASNLSN